VKFEVSSLKFLGQVILYRFNIVFFANSTVFCVAFVKVFSGKETASMFIIYHIHILVCVCVCAETKMGHTGNFLDSLHATVKAVPAYHTVK
jgi:hypothetical protein